MTLIERLGAAGARHVVAIYDRRPRQAPRRRQRLDLSRLSARTTWSATRTSTSSSCSRPCPSTARSRGGARGGQARARREADGDVARGGGELLEVAAVAPGHLLCAPHILLSPTYRAMHARVGGRDRRGPARRAPATAGRARLGALVLRAGRRRAVRPRRLQRHALCGFFGPARRVTAMTGVAIPERVIDGEPMQVEAEDNAHVLIDFGDGRLGGRHDRLHDAEVPLARDRALRHAGVLQLLGDDWAPEGYELWRNGHGAWEVLPETDPAWPWTDGLRHLVDCIADRRARSRGPSTPTTRSRSCSPRRRRAPTAARARSRATSRRPTSRAAAPPTTTAGSTIRGQPCDDPARARARRSTGRPRSRSRR